MPDGMGICAVVASTRKPLEVQCLGTAKVCSWLINHLTGGPGPVQDSFSLRGQGAQETVSASELCLFPLALKAAARDKKRMGGGGVTLMVSAPEWRDTGLSHMSNYLLQRRLEVCQHLWMLGARGSSLLLAMK